MKTACILCFVWKCFIISSMVRKLVTVRWFKHMLHRKFNGLVSSTCISAARKMSPNFTSWRIFWASDDVLPVGEQNINVNQQCFSRGLTKSQVYKGKFSRNVIKKMRCIYPKYPVQRVSIQATWTEILKINWNKIGLFVSCNPTQSVHGFESYVCLVFPVELCWHQNQWIKLELKLLLELQSKKKSD